METIKSTFDKVSEIKDVKTVFEIVYDGFTREYQGGRFTEYHEIGETILQFVKDTSVTFASDIAEKALKYGKPSYKQSWVVAYEFIKNAHMYDAWVEKMEAKFNELNPEK